VQYQTNPPTSGNHYGDQMGAPVPAGVYDASNMKQDEDVVHALEHGYVVIWYACAKAPGGNCDTLKAGLKDLWSQLSGERLIVMPRDNMPTMLAMTSWMKLQRFDAFDVAKMTAFYRRNVNNGPEPGAP
jgi:hypothetical protein